MGFADPNLLKSLFIILGVAWGSAVLAVLAIIIVLNLALRSLLRSSRAGLREHTQRWRTRISVLAVVLGVLLAASASGWALWLTGRNEDVLAKAQTWWEHIPADFWLSMALGAGRVVIAAIAAAIGGKIIAAILGIVHRRVGAWSHLRAEPENVRIFFTSLTRLARITLWLLVVVYASEQLFLPDTFAKGLRTVIIVYLIIAVGLLLVRATAAIVDTLDALSRTYLEKTSWLRWYDAARPLIPLLRRIVEYALWVGTGTLAFLQIEALAGIAGYGPRLIEALGIFFIARVAIELGHLLISAHLLREDLNEDRRKRNLTFAPLLKSLFKGAVCFAAAVLILGALGLDTTPFLAGAGIIGMVIGLGAQPMINDLMSGFFIIFENQFLIGDTIEVDGARGTVEGIDFRTTRLRDLDGRVHLIRNGDCRRVINYSKDFTNAVVRVAVPIEADLVIVQAALTQADRRLRETNSEDLLAATEFVLVEALADGHCTTRTLVRTKAGRHWVIAAELRRLLREELLARGIAPALPRRLVENRAGIVPAREPSPDAGHTA